MTSALARVGAPHARASGRESWERPTGGGAVTVGYLAGFDVHGRPQVAVPAGDADASPTVARTLVPLGSKHIGREVALLFEDGDVHRPIVQGILQPPAPQSPEPDGEAGARGPSFAVDTDGQRVVLTAEREIVLRCGDASITLTRAGKVLISGAFVLTRATGVNRIRGGSVQIN